MCVCVSVFVVSFFKKCDAIQIDMHYKRMYEELVLLVFIVVPFVVIPYGIIRHAVNAKSATEKSSIISS